MGIKINDLTAAAVIKASDVLPISQDDGAGGRNTLKVNMQQVAAYAASGVSGGITSVGIISDGSLEITGSPLVANGNIHVALSSVGLDKISNAGATDGDVIKYNGSTSTWVASAASVYVPSGCIMMWGTSTPPTGWIECAGQSTSSYANLLAIYGANVPDLRGEFVRGWDNGKGTDSGRALKSTQGDAFESHKHHIIANATADANPTADNTLSVDVYVASGLLTNDNFEYQFRGVNSPAVLFSSESVGNTETRPRNVALMYIIKT